MSRKIVTRKSLIIVESPAKCKKIEEILGSGYTCIASFGHLRNIPDLRAIDIENNFAPRFKTVDSKEQQISKIKKAIHTVIIRYILSPSSCFVF